MTAERILAQFSLFSSMALQMKNKTVDTAMEMINQGGQSIDTERDDFDKKHEHKVTVVYNTDSKQQEQESTATASAVLTALYNAVDSQWRQLQQQVDTDTAQQVLPGFIKYRKKRVKQVLFDLHFVKQQALFLYVCGFLLYGTVCVVFVGFFVFCFYFIFWVSLSSDLHGFDAHCAKPKQKKENQTKDTHTCILCKKAKQTKHKHNMIIYRT